MKTVIVFINSMSAPGGIERVVSNLLKEWVKNYHILLLVKDDVNNSFYEIPDEVERFSLNEPLNLDMHNRKQRMRAVLTNAIRSHKKLKAFLSRTAYDDIYTTTPLNSLEVYTASADKGRRLVISEHASAFAVNGIYQKIKRFVYPKAKVISVPNKMDCEVYKSWGCNTVYIPHLVTFQAKEQNKLDSKIALNIGRYTTDKRQAELIEIWARVKNKNGWQLWIVGKGEEEANLQATIERCNVNDSVKLIPYTKNIADIYRKGSLFLFTSRMEGFGMVLLEAMAFGIPCISYDCPSGPRDVVQDGVNGYLITNNDSKQFEDRLQQVLVMNQPELNKIGCGAFNTIVNWNNKEILQDWYKIFS